MEKKRRGRPPKDKSLKPIKVPGKRGRPPKEKAHIALSRAFDSDGTQEVEQKYIPHEHLTKDGQKTKCCKCGIDMAMHIQPLLTEDQLAKIKCSVCAG